MLLDPVHCCLNMNLSDGFHPSQSWPAGDGVPNTQHSWWKSGPQVEWCFSRLLSKDELKMKDRPVKNDVDHRRLICRECTNLGVLKLDQQITRSDPNFNSSFSSCVTQGKAVAAWWAMFPFYVLPTPQNPTSPVFIGIFQFRSSILNSPCSIPAKNPNRIATMLSLPQALSHNLEPILVFRSQRLFWPFVGVKEFFTVFPWKNGISVLFGHHSQSPSHQTWSCRDKPKAVDQIKPPARRAQQGRSCLKWLRFEAFFVCRRILHSTVEHIGFGYGIPIWDRNAHQDHARHSPLLRRKKSYLYYNIWKMGSQEFWNCFDLRIAPHPSVAAASPS